VHNRTFMFCQSPINISSSVGDEDKAPSGPPGAPAGGLLAALERTAALCVVSFTWLQNSCFCLRNMRWNVYSLHPELSQNMSSAKLSILFCKLLHCSASSNLIVSGALAIKHRSCSSSSLITFTVSHYSSHHYGWQLGSHAGSLAARLSYLP